MYRLWIYGLWANLHLIKSKVTLLVPVGKYVPAFDPSFDDIWTIRKVQWAAAVLRLGPSPDEEWSSWSGVDMQWRKKVFQCPVSLLVFPTKNNGYPLWDKSCFMSCVAVSTFLGITEASRGQILHGVLVRVKLTVIISLLPFSKNCSNSWAFVTKLIG